jgi:hypothetical protein
MHGTTKILQVFDHAVLCKWIHVFQKTLLKSLHESRHCLVGLSDVLRSGFPFLQSSVLESFFKVVKHFWTSSPSQFVSTVMKAFFNVEQTFNVSVTVENRRLAFSMSAIIVTLSEFDGFQIGLHKTALVFNAWCL